MFARSLLPTVTRPLALMRALLLPVIVAGLNVASVSAQSAQPQSVETQASQTRAVQTQAVQAQFVQAQSPATPTGNIRLDSGRFVVVAGLRDHRMAKSLMAEALARDTFPGLARPRERVLIAIAPDAPTFRAWVGPGAPEWGAAIAMPHLRRIVMQGSYGSSGAGNPLVVLRHELAHLALYEAMGDLPPRWFNEGYASVAAAEWDRTTALETSVAMVWRSLPAADELNAGFHAGATKAQFTYALAHLAVAEMQGIGEGRGLANFFEYWKRTGSYELAVRQAFGMTSSSFDAYWHKRIRLRYGALALGANLSIAFGFLALLLGPVYWRRKRRNRMRLDAMRAAEAAQEEAARRSALHALLALEVAANPEDDADAAARSV